MGPQLSGGGEKPQRAGSLQVCVWGVWWHASDRLERSLKPSDRVIPASYKASHDVQGRDAKSPRRLKTIQTAPESSGVSEGYRHRKLEGRWSLTWIEFTAA